jgi:hypothetical protein
MLIGRTAILTVNARNATARRPAAARTLKTAPG